MYGMGYGGMVGACCHPPGAQLLLMAMVASAQEPV